MKVVEARIRALSRRAVALLAAAFMLGALLLGAGGGAPVDARARQQATPLIAQLVTPADLGTAFVVTSRTANMSGALTALTGVYPDLATAAGYIGQADEELTVRGASPNGVTHTFITLAAFRSPRDADAYMSAAAALALNENPPPAIPEGRALEATTVNAAQNESRIVTRRGSVIIGVRMLGTSADSVLSFARQVASIQIGKLTAAATAPASATPAQPVAARTPAGGGLTSAATPAVSTPVPTAVAADTPADTSAAIAPITAAPPVAVSPAAPTATPASDEDPPQPSL